MERRALLKATLSAALLPLSSKFADAQLVRKYAEELRNGEYNWFPERSLSGPLLIIVSIPDQKLHVYRNGIRIAASSCTTGKPGHRTPTGVFKILQKDKHHRSSTYSNAPMPNMNRLTWSGIAIHAGNLPGYPASHGCIRVPMGFSELLFDVTRMGMTVVLADNNSNGTSVVHPKLILSDDARNKFHAVDAHMRSAAGDPDRNPKLAHTSIVVSGHDKQATLYENDVVLLRSKVAIAEPDRKLANASYSLTRANRAKEEMSWRQVSYDKNSKDGTKTDLPRIKAPSDFSSEVHRRTHLGMTLVTTADRHEDIHRSKGDFVVFDGLY